MPIEHYLNYFADQNRIVQWRYEKDEGMIALTNFLNELQGENLINQLDWNGINAAFFAGNITRMNVAPGFEISRKWNLDQVIQWEVNNELENLIIHELNNLLASWGEKL